MRSPGTTVGESGAWVVCQSTGDSCPEEIFIGEHLNILGGTENESLHSSWGMQDLQLLRDLKYAAGNWNSLVACGE